MKTQFKQKSCKQCGNNHDNDGVICSFCIEKEELRRAKEREVPLNYWVKTKIVREGDTVLTIGNVRYTFKHNEHGDSVCEIINPGHYNRIINNDFYEPYTAPETNDSKPENEKSSVSENEILAFIEGKYSEGLKAPAISDALKAELGIDLTWQKIIKLRET